MPTIQPSNITHCDAALSQLDQIQDDWIAIDTEFVRRNTYYPILALLQIATPDGQCYLIDPLSCEDLTPLQRLLTNPNVTKVFHSAEQDLECLWHMGLNVSPVVDTQLMAILAKYGTGIGYGRFIHQLLGVELPKSETTSDWLARPLSDKQWHYALDDVTYLAQAYPLLQTQLDQTQHQYLQWDYQHLYDPTQQTHLTKWHSWRNLGHLSAPLQAKIEAVFHVRDRLAKTHNLPRNWILPDAAIQHMAQQFKRQSFALNLYRLPKVQPKWLKQFGDALQDAWENAPSQPQAAMPKYHTLDFTAQQAQWIQTFTQDLNDLAQAWNIQQPAHIIKSSDIKRLAVGEDTQAKHQQGWRGYLLQPLLAHDLP